MSDQTNGAAPAAPLAPAGAAAPAQPGKSAPAPAAGKSAPASRGGGKSAAPAGKYLGKSLDGAASGSVAYTHIRGVPQAGREGTRLHIVLTEGGLIGYSLRRGGDFATLVEGLPASGNLPAVKADAPFCAPYTAEGLRQLVRMLASLRGVTKNRDQANAAQTVAGHIPPAVAVACGLPRVTQVAGARRPTGRAGSV